MLLQNALKKDATLVFIKKMETKTGTRKAVGIANIYDSLEHAKLIEPEYIVKRNMPVEKQERRRRIA
jgi:ribosomal protein S24E